MTLPGGWDGLGAGEAGRRGQVRRLERRVGDADVDGAAVKWTGWAWEGGSERARALSRERERAAVKLPREGGAEGARALSWERVRPGGRVEEGGRLSQTLIAVDLVPVSNGSECVKEKN